jgi:hypothetical protein
MATNRNKASRALRRRARARIQQARGRSQQVLGAWKAAADSQLAALNELGSGLSASADDDHTAGDCATDLCAFLVGCWADAGNVLQEACSAWVHPQGILPVAIGPDGIEFQIEQIAEAADPKVITEVSLDEADALSIDNPLASATSSTSIPPRNIRISTYKSSVLISLVGLGACNLVPGVYAGGNLVFDGDQVLAPIQVTVT